MPKRVVFGLLVVAIGAAIGAFGLGLLPWGAALLWPSLSFVLVGVAYVSGSPALFGKRPDGSMALGSRVLLAPYLGFMLGIWYVIRRFHTVADRVAPGILLGQRPLGAEALEDASLIVDLTSELTELAAVRAGREYLCLPTLDGAAPSEAALRAVLPRLTSFEGTMYVHCAAGHGRSATVVAAILVKRGLAGSPRDAVAMLRAAGRLAFGRAARSARSRVLLGAFADTGGISPFSCSP